MSGSIDPEDGPAALEARAEAGDAGQRLDRFLADRLPELSRTRIKALIEAGSVARDGVAETSPKAAVAPGLYTVDAPPPEPAAPAPEAIPLSVLFEDADLIVLDKPAGMTVHPAPGSPSGTLVNALLHHCAGQLSGVGGVARPGIVHRLDKDTSGVMVAAKSDRAHRALSEMFAAHDLDRRYVAVTKGAPRPLIGRIETRLARDPRDRQKMKAYAIVDSEDEANAPGKWAATEYRALRTFGASSSRPGEAASALIECSLETGRTHQIRVHLASIGAPVIGDPLYGGAPGLRLSGDAPAVVAARAAARGFPRQALHARTLAFAHPVTGEAMLFDTDPPADMAGLIDALSALDGLT